MNLVEFEDWVHKRWQNNSVYRFGQCSELHDDDERDKVMSIAAMGLAGEAGETVEHFKKKIRDGAFVKEEVALELGDVLHYLTILTAMSGLSLAEIACKNRDKLIHRDVVKRREELSQ